VSTITCRPRIEFDTDGYVRLRAYDPELGGDRYLYLHRLAAYAHGEISTPWEEKDVHHRDRDRWNNRPENLEARPPFEHRRGHLEAD
jgi:hypothetical protein